VDISPLAIAPTSGECGRAVSLHDIRRGEFDALGDRILQVCWLGADYAIYRTSVGVSAQFSDCAERAAWQRHAFMKISPELCELRFLTSEMRREGWLRQHLRKLFSRDSDGAPLDVIFDHNMAQALMLVMEGNEREARQVARAALDLAVKRTTNDNTIRYVKSSMKAAFVLSLVMLSLVISIYYQGILDLYTRYIVAGLSGMVGAFFSIMARVSSFEMKPCQSSNMNFWMARLRIGLGLIGGVSLLLLIEHPGIKGAVEVKGLGDWQGAALVGFLGGFAERLAPSLFGRAARTIQQSAGTPVQEARHRAEHEEEESRDLHKTVRDRLLPDPRC
jgi:hypothetical protein